MLRFMSIGFCLPLKWKFSAASIVVKINADHMRQHAHINHIADQIAKIGRDGRVAAHELFDWHGIDGDIGTRDRLLDIVSVEKCSARRNRCQVAREQVWVDRDDDLLLFASWR